MKPRPRTFGSKKPSRASKDVAAINYLVNAREPTADALVRLFGVKPAEADRMIREERQKRSMLI